jgi:hypothetical protein
VAFRLVLSYLLEWGYGETGAVVALAGAKHGIVPAPLQFPPTPGFVPGASTLTPEWLEALGGEL